MRWMRDCWDSTTARTVINCWRHTGLIEQGRIAAGQMEQEIRGTGTSTPAVVNLGGVEAALSALVSPQVRACMAVANLVSPEGENDCHEVVDINSSSMRQQRALEVTFRARKRERARLCLC